ncbi:MAG: bifunctional glutamate N-acetyltransferase/amino-acid acetyltransferase ArgJ [Clostridiales Family XIII bacterium]|jgi:glutamate N-acetyltransferase/amino-acid N-acetyltransferase|nr:bifunctional glutamate N-acetyltransferase/amino-acid acetyltransferase ArgJ [Clostridiales Family XIII bacterium]
MNVKEGSNAKNDAADSAVKHAAGHATKNATKGGKRRSGAIAKADGGICAPSGFRAAGVHCGFRKNTTKKDLALIVSDVICNAAAVYTRNKVQGAPIVVNREHLKDGRAGAIICNSGIANTCAPGGVEIARETCRLAAAEIGMDAQDIIVCSTGVIGEPLNIETFRRGIPRVAKKLSYDDSDGAARAIMTTDRMKKETAVSFVLDGKRCHIGGIAKGSGMINPNMATMLSFITTDVAISAEMLKYALGSDVVDTYNQISIDGDTSTNDTVAALANGLAGNPEIDEAGASFDLFCAALRFVTSELCRGIVKDGEGASKLLECVVKGAPTGRIARIVSSSVVRSSLVKTAMFGEDANWGRILCAVGYADADFECGRMDIFLSSEAGEVMVCHDSEAVRFDEELAKRILAKDEIRITVDLRDGLKEAVAYGCDLTYQYVRINGRYRT